MREHVPRQSPFIIELSPAERAALESASHRYSAPYRDVVRARIVLLAAQDLENVETVSNIRPAREHRLQREVARSAIESNLIVWRACKL